MTKKLIYYFYLTPEFKDNRANRLNLLCLRNYANIFDCAEIYLSMDDVTDTDLIHEAEIEFVSMPFNGNISFKVIQNTEYCEAKVIKEEIVDKIGTLDCLVFFGHAKGYTSFDAYQDTNLDGIQKWVVGCYFLSLEYIEKMETAIGPGKYTECVYGSFPIVAKDKITEDDFNDFEKIFAGYIKYNWYFSGTFFWINTKKLYNYINVFSPSVPKMSNRYFGECFFGNLFRYYRNGMGHNQRSLYPCNFYNEGVVDSSLDFILEPEERNRFDELYEKIISNT